MPSASRFFAWDTGCPRDDRTLNEWDLADLAERHRIRRAITPAEAEAEVCQVMWLFVRLGVMRPVRPARRRAGSC